eukprot:UN20857
MQWESSFLEFFSETSRKMEKPHSSSYALQDLQHSCITSHISRKYIETTSKLKKKVI